MHLILYHLILHVWIIHLELYLSLILRLLLRANFLLLRFISSLKEQFLDFIVVDVVLFRIKNDLLLLQNFTTVLN
jgi:hypothetical protein